MKVCSKQAGIIAKTGGKEYLFEEADKPIEIENEKHAKGIIKNPTFYALDGGKISEKSSEKKKEKKGD